MPYRRYRRRPYRRRRYRRYRRRRRVAGSGRTWWDTAHDAAEFGVKYGPQLAYLASKVAMLNVEVKNHDVAASAITIPQAAGGLSLIHLTDINQGDTAETRDGNSIKLLKCNLRSVIKTGGADARFRIMIVQFNYNNGLTFTSTDLLDTPTDIKSFYRLTTTRNWRVLYDSQGSIETGVRDQVNRNRYLPNRRHVKFDGNLGSNIAAGGIYMLAITDVATSNPTWDYFVRLRFVDN